MVDPLKQAKHTHTHPQRSPKSSLCHVAIGFTTRAGERFPPGAVDGRETPAVDDGSSP